VVAAELLAESPERERVIFERAWSAGYAVGFDAGAEVGYRRACAELAREWAEVSRGVRQTAGRPTVAELDMRRWGGRREDFGRPRPGDYMGGPVEWAPAGRAGAA
jgi:hypothetical protein